MLIRILHIFSVAFQQHADVWTYWTASVSIDLYSKMNTSKFQISGYDTLEGIGWQKCIKMRFQTRMEFPPLGYPFTRSPLQARRDPAWSPIVFTHTHSSVSKSFCRVFILFLKHVLKVTHWWHVNNVIRYMQSKSDQLNVGATFYL